MTVVRIANATGIGYPHNGSMKFSNKLTYGARHFAENHFAEKTFRLNDTMPKILLRCDTWPKVSND